MDLNNDKYLDFTEFSKILMGSLRAEFRVRALFMFYAYDEGQKGLAVGRVVLVDSMKFKRAWQDISGKMTWLAFWLCATNALILLAKE